MDLPAFLLGFMISSLYGVLYHLVRDGSLGRLLARLALAWTGFAVGLMIGYMRDWSFLAVGPLNVGMGTLGSLLLLGVGDLAGRIRGKPQSRV
jgi:hypothetical protein